MGCLHNSLYRSRGLFVKNFAVDVVSHKVQVVTHDEYDTTQQGDQSTCREIGSNKVTHSSCIVKRGTIMLERLH